MIKSKILKWAGHVAYMGERRVAYRVLLGKLREGDFLEETGVHGKIILKWIFENWNRGAWNGPILLRIGIDE
jgi:hypothetical protein